MPLLNPSKDFDLNEKFDLNKYKIVLYLTKSLLYNALASLATSGNNLVFVLEVLNNESIAN
jgi:hypothetical protein